MSINYNKTDEENKEYEDFLKIFNEGNWTLEEPSPNSNLQITAPPLAKSEKRKKTNNRKNKKHRRNINLSLEINQSVVVIWGDQRYRAIVQDESKIPEAIKKQLDNIYKRHFKNCITVKFLEDATYSKINVAKIEYNRLGKKSLK